MKTIHGYKNKGSFEHLVFLLLMLCFAMTACKWDNDFCKLTDNDKEFLLENTDYLEYLENGNTKIKVEVETKYNNSWNKGGSWFYTGDGGYESGYSAFYLPDSALWIQIKTIACNEELGINLFSNPSLSTPISSFICHKDSLIKNDIEIQGTIYHNCIKFNDTISVKELIYAKGFGIIRLQLHEDYILEFLTKK